MEPPEKEVPKFKKNGFHMLLMNGARSCSVLSVSQQCPNSLPDSGLCQWTKSTMKQETVRELEDIAVILLENHHSVSTLLLYLSLATPINVSLPGKEN